jgi:hypothetical protein
MRRILKDLIGAYLVGCGIGFLLALLQSSFLLDGRIINIGLMALGAVLLPYVVLPAPCRYLDMWIENEH